MFDLEKSIAEWRKQMLAVGIKTPVPLEELEIHLREEIEQQMQSGFGEEHAFKSAVWKIGQAGLLKTEFKKAGGFIDWLGENKSARINRVLGLLWLAYCSWMLLLIATCIPASVHAPSFSGAASVLSSAFVVLTGGYIYLCGVIGSIRLFRGVTRDRRLIRLLALLSFIGCFVQFNALKTISMMAVVIAVFSLVSIWFLRPPKKEIPKLAGN
jgi:hypothetical protein